VGVVVVFECVIERLAVELLDAACGAVVRGVAGVELCVDRE